MKMIPKVPMAGNITNPDEQEDSTVLQQQAQLFAELNISNERRHTDQTAAKPMPQHPLSQETSSRHTGSAMSHSQRTVGSKLTKRGARIASISGGKMVFPPNFFGQYEEKR